MTKFEAKAKKEFEIHAKEPLVTEEIGTFVYAFGSELACLRLANVYRHARHTFGYSENLKTWFFGLERRFS